MNQGIFSSRKDKAFYLKEVIQKLRIEKEEKELYILSLEVLEDKEFEIFFRKIVSQIGEKNTSFHKKNIEPFTPQLL